MTQVAFRNVPAFAVHLDATIEVQDARPRHGRRRVGRHVLRHRRRRAVRPAADAGRRARHHAHRRADQGRDAGAAARRPSRRTRRSATSRSRSSRDRRRRPATIAATPSIVSTGTLDWDRPSTWTGAHRSLAVRHRHLREDGHAARARHARPRPSRSVTKACSARSSPERCWRKRPIGPYRAVVPELSGDRVDHRLRAVRRRSAGSVPGRLHGRRYLVTGSRVLRFSGSQVLGFSVHGSQVLGYWQRVTPAIWQSGDWN